MKTGNWKTSGRQAASGFTPCSWKRAICSRCMRWRSSLYFSWISFRYGCSACISRMPCMERKVNGRTTMREHQVIKMIPMPQASPRSSYIQVMTVSKRSSICEMTGMAARSISSSTSGRGCRMKMRLRCSWQPVDADGRARSGWKSCGTAADPRSRRCRHGGRGCSGSAGSRPGLSRGSGRAPGSTAPRTRSRSGSSGSEEPARARSGAGRAESGRAGSRRATVSRQTLLAWILNQLGQGGAQTLLSLPLEQPLDTGPGDDHVVVPRLEAVRELPERLPDRALHLVPGHRLADLPADGEAEPGAVVRILLAAGERVEHQEAVAAGVALPVDAIEVAAPGETAAASIRTALGGQRQLGVSRLRPF